jgi:hypothetical protein
VSNSDVVRLLEVLFPGLVMLALVGGLMFRLTVKPTIDAILRLREGLRTDQDQAQQRIARLEDEVARLRSGDIRPTAALGESAWPKDPVRRD